MKSVIATLLLLLTAVNLSAQSHYLDQSFGDGGVATTDKLLNIEDMAFDNDGRIIALSKVQLPPYNFSWYLSRYDEFGNIDASFGSEEGVETLFFETRFSLDEIYISEGNKILLPGSRSIDFFKPLLAKCTENGIFDNSFGDNGIFINEFSEEYVWNNPFTELANGQFLFGGRKRIYESEEDVRGRSCAILVKFNADTTIDPSFGKEGMIVFNGSDFDFGPAVTLPLRDGNIVCGGGMSVKAGSAFVITKLTLDGYLVEDFGEKGKIIVDVIPNQDFSTWNYFEGCLEIIELSNSQLIVIGYTDGNEPQPAIIKINADGTLDKAFADDGVLEVFERTQQGRFYYDGLFVDEITGHIVLSGRNSEVPTINRYDVNSGKLVVGEPVNFPPGAYMNKMIAYPDGSLLFGGFIGSEAALIKMLYRDIIPVEATASDNLIIYPNPFDKAICVEYSGEELKSLALYDQSGRRVFQKTVEGFNVCVEPNLPPGTYALVIEIANGKKYSKKIVKL